MHCHNVKMHALWRDMVTSPHLRNRHVAHFAPFLLPHVGLRNMTAFTVRWCPQTCATGVRPNDGSDGGRLWRYLLGGKGTFQQNRIFPFGIYRGLSPPSELSRR